MLFLMIKISLEQNTIQAAFNYHEDYIKRMRLVPGAKFNRKKTCWEIPFKSFSSLEKTFKGEIVYITPRFVITGEPEKNYHSDIIPVNDIPTALPLYNFQKFGSSFLYQRSQQEGFAFLCDATGIGKTPQALGARLLMAEKKSPLSTLVVTPAAIRHQWVADAIPKFLGDSASVVEVEDTQERRLKLYGTAEITVVSYEALLRDADQIPKNVQFDLVILDECQKIKNHQGKTYNALKRLFRRMPNVVYFFLTATPMMNDLNELYALFELAKPGFFGSYHKFSKNHIRIDFSPGYPRLIGYKNLDELAAKIGPYILRRTEDHPEVAAALPKLVTQNLYVEPSEQQKKVHKAIHDKWTELMEKRKYAREPELIGILDARCRGYTMLMQGAANDLRLFFMSTSKMAKKYAKMCSSFPSASPKIKYLAELVDDLLPQGKVVIFTCFERMAQLIVEALQKHNPGLFTGKNKDVRDNELRRFWNDPNCRVLVLTDAGGVGLNIQKARFLINFDPHWSPGQIEQRYGRIKRFGSEHSSILAINLISRGTIDERILAALERKDDVFKAVITTSN